MKKEYLDSLYESRSFVQTEIDELAESEKQPRSGDCNDCGDTVKAELGAKRLHIRDINVLIEKYIIISTRN